MIKLQKMGALTKSSCFGMLSASIDLPWKYFINTSLEWLPIHWIMFTSPPLTSKLDSVSICHISNEQTACEFIKPHFLVPKMSHAFPMTFEICLFKLIEFQFKDCDAFEIIIGWQTEMASTGETKNTHRFCVNFSVIVLANYLCSENYWISFGYFMLPRWKFITRTVNYTLVHHWVFTWKIECILMKGFAICAQKNPR